ncbi:RnfABCDGE type electron transport complex subunit D [Desulfovibrio aminophilus]|uniref:RnfABCDGE type electron transport complex subunit D n=1 Tax=Desulfovibrio aminophilus TaxID=81425 RepID=UPI003398F0E6
MSERLWRVSISPHLRDEATVSGIMWTVFAVLQPQLLLSVFTFGPRVLVLAAVGVGTAVLSEALMQRLLDKPVRISDGSAALTGLLLVYVLPPGVSLTLPFWGALFAICIGKQLFGGLGFNFFNPALIARAFLTVGFPVAMTTAWIMPELPSFLVRPDALSSATPLYLLKHSGAAAYAAQFGGEKGLWAALLGFRPGCVGETSPVLLLLGGLYLLRKRIISWHIPLSMIACVALLAWVFGPEGAFSGDPLVHVLSGGLILGAFFMATDYVTSPSRPAAKLLYGAGAGALTMLIRLKGGYPEGVCYAILLMNCLSPVLEEWVRPRRFAPPLPKE